MDTQDLYNFSPAIRLMVMGLVVAAGPLVWVWLRSRDSGPARRLQVLTLVTLFLTFDLVVFGAFTRLTDSGLGCPDWPGCYGHASPVGAQMHIETAQAAMPSGPVTHSKAWVEMVHRYLATGVGVMILTLTIASWLERRREHAEKNSSEVSVAWPLITLVWVCLQGAFGALTVTMKLFPAIVTLHLLGGLVLLALLKAQSARHAATHRPQANLVLPVSLRKFALATYVLLWLQIALGGWVSTNYAVLACTSFPSCQGSLWPAMDFSQGFTLWRQLGANGEGGNISFQALTAIHYVHRLMAYAVFAAMLVLAVKLHRHAAWRTQGRWLAGLALLQVATGLGNVLLGWPLLAAVMHTGGAAGLVMVLTGVVFSGSSAAKAAKEHTTAPASKLSASRLPA